MTAAVREEKHAEAVSFDAGVVLRPRTLDETLDLALAYMRGSARDFAKVTALSVGLSSVILIAVSIALELTIFQRAAVALWLAPIVEQITTVFGGRHLFKNAPRARTALLTIVRRLPRVLFTSFLITLPWTPMLLTNFEGTQFIVMCVIIGSFWPFLLASQIYRSEVSLLEQLSFRRTGQRTKSLIVYRFSRALGVLLMTGIVRVLIAGGLELTVAFVLGFLLQFKDVSDAIGGWAAAIGYLLAAPYVAMARMFDYVDARTRREGWDIQVRFNAIAQSIRDADAKHQGARGIGGAKAA